MRNAIKVVILCGGAGTRMKEETDFRPKSMVKIGTKPIIWHIMKIYAYYGFTDFVLCLGYKGEMIKDYFYHYSLLNNDFTVQLGNHKNIEIHSKNQEEDWRITLVDTGEKALKGARIKRIEKYINTDIFMLTYGDGVADINIADLLSFHHKHKRIATVTGVRPPSRFGALKVKGGKVFAFVEKPQTSQGLVNGGFFVLHRKIFRYLVDRDDCDFEKGILGELAKENELMLYEHKGEWECMDTFRDLEYLNNVWQERKAFWKVWHD